MLESPPPTPFSTMAWPDLDHHQDPKSHERKSYTINSDINIAACEPLVHCPDPSGSTKVGVQLNRSTPSTSMSSELMPTITTFKKLDHNASERDRRKKINTLYSTLRSLLPAADQEKKLSTPATVSRVVKYIPDLQQQVEGLIQKKEALLSRISSSKPQGDQQNNQGNIHRKSTIAGISSSHAVSANWLNDTEVMVQISTYKLQKSPLTEILFDLEKDGFLLLNASSVVSFGGTAVYNLHLQVDMTCILEREVWNEINFPSLHMKGKEFNDKRTIGSIHFNDLPI
ncbi:hypothetical protein F2P56_020854 [Juglans regia]|uniref:Transcription factor ORG2-like n=2 Tax=Juglans regia TaxID=51240 RepID=A0A2I4EW25_JUGRE|nr:transcription factor ORG2-like [Juglans regia]KAF5461025.1 hypothetical protein F2P56_020854 [Juglans regia]